MKYTITKKPTTGNMMKYVITDISVWVLTIIGFVAKILPLVQLLSLLLAIAVSCITIYKFIKKQQEEDKEDES